MIKKHNFISKEYVRNIEKRDKRLYMPIVMVLLAVNILAFQNLQYKLMEVEEAGIQSVFSDSTSERVIDVKQTISIFELRRKINVLLNNNAEIISFTYESGKIVVEIISDSEKHCINFVKNLEQDLQFEIISLSPIEVVEKKYKLLVELAGM